MSFVDRLADGVSLLTLRLVSYVLSGVGVSMVLLRTLGPDDYGWYALAIAVAWLASLATGNLDEAARRFLPEHLTRDEAPEANALLLTVVVGKLGLGALVTAAMFAFAPGVARALGHDGPLLILLAWAGVHVAGTAAEAVGHNVLLGMQSYRGPAVTTAAGGLLAFGIALYVWLTGLGLVPTFVLLVSARLLVSLALLGWAGWELTRTPAWTGLRIPARPVLAAVVRRTLRYALPLWGGQASYMISQQAAKVVLGAVATPAAVGYFSLGKLIVDQLVQLYQQIPSALLPALAQRMGRRGAAAAVETVGWMGPWVHALGVAMTAGVFLLAPEFVLVLGGPEFAPAVPIARVLCLLTVIRLPAMLWGLLYQTHERTLRLLWAQFVRVGAMIAALVWVAEPFGIAGAAWVELLSYVLALAIVLVDVPIAFGVRRGPMLRLLARSHLATAALIALGAAAQALVPAPWDLPARAAVLLLLPLALTCSGTLTRADLDHAAAVTFERRLYRLASRLVLRWVERVRVPALADRWRPTTGEPGGGSFLA